MLGDVQFMLARALRQLTLPNDATLGGAGCRQARTTFLTDRASAVCFGYLLNGNAFATYRIDRER